jgi:hypothetical protein
VPGCADEVALAFRKGCPEPALRQWSVRNPQEEDEMKPLTVVLVVLALGVTAPAVATAQGRVPHTESTAFSLDGSAHE